MNKHVLKSLGILGLAGLSVCSSAFSQELTRLTAQVPFDFQVGNVQETAGEYKVARLRNGVLIVTSKATLESKAFLSTSYGLKPKLEKSYLVFHHIGDRYFLSQVWDARSALGVQLPRSKSEKEMKAALPTGKFIAQVRVPIS